jgi:hypothetical protein
MKEDTQKADRAELRVKSTHNERGFLRNLAVNIKGKSVAVVLTAYLFSLVAIAIRGNGPHAGTCLTVLASFGPLYFNVLGQRVD